MKLKLDLYYVNATSYTEFRVNISEDCREKYPLKLLNGIWQNLSLPGSKISTSSTRFEFLGWSEEQYAPGLWLDETFSTSPRKLINGIWRNLTWSMGGVGEGGVGAGVDWKTKIAARPLIDRGTYIVTLDYIVS